MPTGIQMNDNFLLWKDSIVSEVEAGKEKCRLDPDQDRCEMKCLMAWTYGRTRRGRWNQFLKESPWCHFLENWQQPIVYGFEQLAIGCLIYSRLSFMVASHTILSVLESPVHANPPACIHRLSSQIQCRLLNSVARFGRDSSSGWQLCQEAGCQLKITSVYWLVLAGLCVCVQIFILQLKDYRVFLNGLRLDTHRCTICNWRSREQTAEREMSQTQAPWVLRVIDIYR